MITIIDEYPRECLAMEGSRRLDADAAWYRLTELFGSRRPPDYIRSDNGPEFTARAVREWLSRVGVKTLYIEPGSPWENGYNESFNGKLREAEVGRDQGHCHSFAAQEFSVFQAFFRYSLLAYLLELEEGRPTLVEMFRHLDEETGRLTFLERLRHYLAALLRRIYDTLADFYEPSPTFRSYLDAITNAFNEFPILQGCER